MGRLNLSTLVIAEHTGERLVPATLNTITAASKLGDVTCLLMADKTGPLAKELSSVEHVKKILVAENASFKGMLAGTTKRFSLVFLERKII